MENPGRVVTLVHKEDWDKFSAAVRPIRFIYTRALAKESSKDAFPDEDVVWGAFMSSARASWPSHVLHYRNRIYN